MALIGMHDEGPEVADIQRMLHTCGLGAVAGPIDGVFGDMTERAVSRFQEMVTWQELVIDGVVGPHTAMALAISETKGGRISEHFHPAEFLSPDTGDVRVLRGLVVALERWRDFLGQPLPVVSGFRTGGHNLSVGGSQRSQHLYGAAVDTPPLDTWGHVLDLQAFSGIGYDGFTGRVLHVDVRHLSDHNPTGSTPGNPATWEY